MYDSFDRRGYLNTVYLLSRMNMSIVPPVGMCHLIIPPPVGMYNLSIAPSVYLTLLCHNQIICHS